MAALKQGLAPGGEFAQFPDQGIALFQQVWLVHVAIQQARLEGVPILTDGGVRVAQTAEETWTLYRWLRARMVTQQRTAWAVRSQAMLMQRAERAVPAEQLPAATLWDLAA